MKRRKSHPGEPPGAVVIGGDYQGLGIVRSLGRHGVPICVIDDEHSISRFSRYTTVWEHVPELRDEKETTHILLDAAKRFDLKGWVLFPTRDELVAALSSNRDVLAEHFRVPTPEWDTVRWMWDKRNTYKLAEKLDIPTARTWFPATVSDLNQIDAPFPLALKPAIKEHFIYATKAKAWQAHTRKELTELFQRATALAGPGEIIVQDIIPGDGSHQFAYCTFFKEGKPLGKMVVRRKRQHPHDFGRSSTFVETIDLPELECLSERFLRTIKYYGLVEVEYKQDPRDGQFKLLDVNARTWGYHTLGPAAGVDFPYQLYLDQIGKTVEPSLGRPGASWVRLLTDIPTGIIGISRGQIKARDYIRSLLGADTEAVFSGKDPLPGIVECVLLPYLIAKRGF